MKKILVPFDYSETAIHAFHFACELAQKVEGDVFVLHVVELPLLQSPFGLPVPDYGTAYLEDIQAKGKQIFEKVSKKWINKIKLDFEVQQGIIINSIHDFSKIKKIDLIVMGSHGSKGFREYAIGSNAEKVVQTSSVPVIVIKKGIPVTSIKNLVFPTNLDLTKSQLVTAVLALQKLFKAKLHVLFVNTPGRFMRDFTVKKRMAEFIKKFQLTNVTQNIFNDIDEEEGIINFSSKINNKMIVMSTHGRKGLNHLFSGSIAEDVVNHIDCPVWTYSK